MAVDQGAATGSIPYEPTRCTCGCLSTFHKLSDAAVRQACSNSNCGCKRFAEASEVKPVVAAYEVCAVPYDEYGNYLSFLITVERTHHTGTWAVRLRGRCLGADGEWDWEHIPSERTDEWLHSHRFDLETALKLAVEVAPTITVNGYTVADALAEEAADA
jgi:hypothetical protein